MPQIATEVSFFSLFVVARFPVRSLTHFRKSWPHDGGRNRGRRWGGWVNSKEEDWFQEWIALIVSIWGEEIYFLLRVTVVKEMNEYTDKIQKKKKRLLR